MLNLARSITKDGSAFSVAIDATNIVSKIKEIHNTSAAVSIALGRLTVAGSMMGALLKNDTDSLTLRIKGNGTAGNLIVVSNGKGFVKSYVDNPSAGIITNDCKAIDIKKVVGSTGMLSVVKNIGLKQPYSSQVPLISGEIGEDITNYYVKSEQIPTVCALGVLLNEDLTIKCAGGFLIQLLPYADESVIDVIEKNLANIKSVSKMLDAGMSPQEISLKVLEGLTPNLLDECEVKYKCDCDRTRTERLLMSLSAKEIENMINDGKPISVECHFCNSKHTFEIDDLKRILVLKVGKGE